MRPTIEQLDEFHEQSKGKTPRVTRDNFQEYLRNPDRQAMQFPSSAEAAKHGFTVEADVIASLHKAKGIEYPSFLEKGDGGSVVGEVVCGRAMILKANKGLLDAVYLRDNSHLIPEEMRGEKVIVFTGTLLRDSDGDLYVAGLDWGGGQWVLDFGWVDDGFRGGCVLPRGK